MHPWDLFQSRLQNHGCNPRRSGNGIAYQCPLHDDRRPSATASFKGDKVLLYCHVCGRGRSEDLLAALGLGWSDLYSDNGQGNRHRQEVEAYDYVDETGVLLYQVVRYQPKDFRQRRPDGRGGWIWSLKDTRRVLYRLPQVIAAVAAGQPIYVPEGEKDVHTLERLGVVATTNSGGAGKWREGCGAVLRGAEVRLIADNDQSGEGVRHVRDVAGKLAGIAGNVVLLGIPSQHKDVTEYVHAGGRLEDLESLASRAHAVQDEPTATLTAIPSYPVEALPPPAHRLVSSAADRGVPAALTGGSAIAALATAIGGRAEVQVDPTWRERAILWIANLADAGAGKSPAQDLAFARLRELDSTAVEGDEMLLSDTRLEALARELAGVGGGACLDVDELTSFLRSLGEYKKGGSGDRGRMLALWSGAPWKLRRVGQSRKSENAVRLSIPHPTLVICGGLQPRLEALLGDEDDGFRSRWLPHYAAVSPARGSGQIETGAWRALLDVLAAARGKPRHWRFSAPATDAFERHRIAFKAAAASEPPSVAGALLKADRHVARIALVLAEAEYPGSGGLISLEVVDRAAQLVWFVIDSWRALPGGESLAFSYRDRVLDAGVAKLLAWLERQPDREATRRQVARARVAGARSDRQVQALIDAYDEAYPGCILKPQSHRGGEQTVIVTAPQRCAHRAH